jgi:DNA-binding SARP family transcriptional activator
VLRFAVLGLIEVHHGDRPVDIGGRFPRRLLAMLLAAEGRPVSADRLAAAIWGEQPPGNPAGALQVYVSRLRRALPGVSVRRVDAGYQLASTTTDTDIGTFTTRIAEARTLVAAGHPGAASDAFEAALQLWRGEPFADVPDDDELNALRAALREQFATAQEDNVAAVLAAGRHDDAVAMSEALTLAAPYRERRSCLLAHALYLSGRQADALAAIRRTRALLADDLGIAPSPQLRDIETQILRQDPALLAGGTAGADHGQTTSLAGARRPAGPRPTTHPAGQRLSSFVGRDADLTLIDQLVTAHRLVTVVGPAGAGKTRLATEYVGASAVVRLAHVNDASLLASAVGAALGVGATTGSLRAALPRRPPRPRQL